MIKELDFNFEKETVEEYPKYMKNNVHEFVVLFSRPGIGMVVKSRDFLSIGKYTEEWAMESFTDYDGIVAGQNVK